MSRSILALDLATSTGWALLDRKGHVTSGVQRFDLARGESSGMRFIRFTRWLDEILRDPLPTSLELGRNTSEHRVRRDGHLVDVIAFERAHHRGGAATEVCVGLMTHMLGLAAHYGVETLPVATTTLKKHATGAGNAKKPDMIRAAAKRWGIEARIGPGAGNELGDDEADALCALSWAIHVCGTTSVAQGP